MNEWMFNDTPAQKSSPVKRTDQWRGIQQERPFRKSEIPLLDPTQHILRAVWLTNGTSRQVQQFVAVVTDTGEQLDNSGLRPVASNDWENLTEYVWPGTITTALYKN